MGAAHEVDKRQVIERFNQQNIWVVAQSLIHSLPHIRIRMDWPNDLRIVTAGQFGNRLTNVYEPFTKALATMRGHNNEFACGVNGNVDAAQPSCFECRTNGKHRVYTCVAR